MMRLAWFGVAALLSATGAPAEGAAAEIKVLTAGAFKQVLLALLPDFERQTGHKVIVDNATVGALSKRIEAGEPFDVAVLTPAAVEDLAAKGALMMGSRTNVARVGVGVMVRAGAPAPEIGSVEAFKQALLAARSIAYIDPESGGSSGIYVARLLDRLGIADQIRPKAKLKKGGYVADLIVSGEADLGLHQISEIVPVKEVRLVGPLPPEIQSYTVYAAAVASRARDPEAAKALIEALGGAAAASVLESRGMQAPGS
jgi:molybdate transport system substrate-binding protein